MIQYHYNLTSNKMCEFYKKGECRFNKNGICKKYKSREDSLSLHCAGSWSEDKIAYFRYYSEMFATGMKNKWPTRFYIDLFSGPGKCIIREDYKEINGTCLEVLNLRDNFSGYFFVDNNPGCIDSLRKRILENSRVRLISKDCNSAVDEIINKIPDYSLNLAIIDPDSLQFGFDSYKKLSEKKIDLIVNYPIGPIERAVSSINKKKYESKILDRFHPGWRDIVNKNTWGHGKKEMIRNLKKDYINQIKKLGYYSSDLFIPFKNSKNATMYYLIALSKSEKGIEFWKKATQGLKKKDRQQPLFSMV